MLYNSLVCFCLITFVVLLSGCGGDKRGAGGQGTGGGEHLKLMNEANDLALKILAARESGKNVDEVNQQFAPQVADIDARIAKLPKLTDDQVIKLMQANASKLREVETKFSALAEKGTLHETGKRLKFPIYTLGDPVSEKS